ncbi:MAG: hypothetical protein JW801_04295 [Bacteroidales bacterium]|nr:hypothetical protein [Bacteroidales bacterium]
MRQFCITLLIALIVAGCNGKIDKNKTGNKEGNTETADTKAGYREGRLEYKITYLNADKDNYDPLILPQVMSLQFNQDFCINSIDGFMNMFRLANVIYFKSHEVFTHLKYFDKNFAYVGGSNDMMCCFDPMSNMIVKTDTATREIAGLKSQRAFISFPDRPDTFSVYYTYDINLPAPNETNPYRKIDGVLTSFRLNMGHYDMEFRATEFNPKNPPEEKFRFPEGTYKVKRDYLVKILEELMSEV